jgi:signal transduction histidine kinase
MTSLVTMAISLAAGALAGAWVTRTQLARRLKAGRDEAERLRAQLTASYAAQQRVAELTAQISVLRHDLRGILSPALLAADRLAASSDPAIRKSGDIVIRTVERATARLAETREAKS